jgi:PAS domain S-box-containing protein
LTLKEEIDQILRQNETLIHTLGLMGARLESALQMLSAISSLTSVPMRYPELGGLNEAAGRVLEILMYELTDISACSILRHAKETDYLELLSARGQADIMGESPGMYNTALYFKPGEGIAGRVFAENTPLFWEKNASGSDHVILTDRAMTVPESLACLPLGFMGRRLGVLNISFSRLRPFDHPRKRSLILLSEVVSNVLMAFQLRAEVDEKAAGLQEARDKLELRVEERTHELVAAGEELKRRIDERERAEKALLESEERYRSLVERTRDGFFIMEAETGRLLFGNQSLCEMFGYSREESEHLSIRNGIDAADIKAVNAALDACLTTRKRGGISGKFNGRRKDGSRFLADASVNVATFQGQPVIQGVVRDVTAEERLRQRDHHSQKMEALGTLAGGVAHDFNNILSAMLGYVELVQLQLPRGSAHRRNLAQAGKAAMRARDLIRQILTFSRQSETVRQPLYVGPIVKEALNLLRATIPATIEIKEDIPADGPPVLSDPTEIHQVIMNLGSNAAQAMRDTGGVLSVTMNPVMVSEEDTVPHPELKTGPHLCLAVKDSGVGMDPMTMARIFEPYFTTRTPDQGTGLGLSVVHGIVSSTGGTILVSSEPGCGSTFRVYWPTSETGVLPSMPLDDGLPRGSEHILLVDDEEALVDIGKQILEFLGYRVTSCSTSSRALRVFSENPWAFDLVITDLTMPHMTGADLSRKMLEIRPDLPIIITTGFAEEEVSDQASDIGVKRFIYKPLVTREIAREIREVLCSNQLTGS